MLPPVAAVSNTNTLAPAREVVVVAEALAGLAAEPDGAVALSLAVSSGVEGKLNMLLINARERILDSLFAVIDAVSQSLALPQQVGESNAGYALRLADTMAALSPKQMAALQQQLSTQGQTAPLALVAAALHDPTGAEAAQLVAYLEVVRYKDKDLATKSVVASYGQNDGSTEPDSAGTAPARATPAQAATMANAAAVLPQAGVPTTPTPPVTAAPTTLQDAADNPPPASLVTVAPEDAPEPQAEPNLPLAAAGNQPSTARTAAAVAQALQTIAPEIATEVGNLAAEAPAASDTTPRVILQIRSDIQEGLKAVFDRLVQATGTELLQTMAEAEPLADKVIAQALIADMIDGTELNGLPLADTAAAQRTVITTALPVSLTSEAVADEPAAQLAATQLFEDAPEPAPAVVPQQPPVPPPGLAVGFVTTPYAPAEDVVKAKDTMRIDRVDAVDDDEHEEPGNQQQQPEPEDEPETSAEEALDMLAAAPDVPLAAAEEPAPSRSSLLALPHHPSPEPLPNPGYSLYERMGA